MIEMCASVARAGSGAGQQRKRPPVPGRAQCRRQGRDLAAGGFQDGRELRLDHEQSLVLGTGILAVGIADLPHQSLTTGETGGESGREHGIDLGEELGDMVQ